MTDQKQNEPTVLETKKNDYLMIDPRNIEANENFNVREDYGDMKWLTEDVRENGVKVPVRVHKKTGFDGIYILTDGFRRHRAAMSILKEYGEVVMIKAILEPKGYNDESRLLDMFNLSEGSKHLNTIEQAKVIGRLLNYGFEPKDIAEKIHKSEAYVSNLNMLNNAPVKLKKFISGKTISATLAVEIIRKNKDSDKALEEIETLMNNGHDALPTERTNRDTIEPPLPKEIKAKKITKKTINKAKGKVNSVSHLRKFMKYFDKYQLTIDDIPTEKHETFNILRGIYDGDYTIDNFRQIFELDDKTTKNKKEE